LFSSTELNKQALENKRLYNAWLAKEDREPFVSAHRGAASAFSLLLRKLLVEQ